MTKLGEVALKFKEAQEQSFPYTEVKIIQVCLQLIPISLTTQDYLKKPRDLSGLIRNLTSISNKSSAIGGVRAVLLDIVLRDQVFKDSVSTYVKELISTETKNNLREEYVGQ